ncbi:unnamed protein product, partial [Notodromas monacha]
DEEITINHDIEHLEEAHHQQIFPTSELNHAKMKSQAANLRVDLDNFLHEVSNSDPTLAEKEETLRIVHSGIPWIVKRVIRPAITHHASSSRDGVETFNFVEKRIVQENKPSSTPTTTPSSPSSTITSSTITTTPQTSTRTTPTLPTTTPAEEDLGFCNIGNIESSEEIFTNAAPCLTCKEKKKRKKSSRKCSSQRRKRRRKNRKHRKSKRNRHF